MENKKLHIDFFHDVLCAWCYALSPRMRKLSEEYHDISIKHRAFALAPSTERLEEMFGSKEEAKSQILNHWDAANANDDYHRINSTLMAEKNHDYPFSTPGLIACKAAEILNGDNGHWDYFDRIQKAHLTDCDDITQRSVLLKCAEDIGLDVNEFNRLLDDEKTVQLVEEDLYLAQQMGVNAVPTLIINNKWIISGAQKYDYLKEVLDKIKNEQI